MIKKFILSVLILIFFVGFAFGITNVIDDFEDNDLAEYSGDTSGFDIQSSIVYEGSFAAQYTGQTNDHYAITDTNVIVYNDDFLKIRLYRTGSSQPSFLYAVQSETGYSNLDSYRVRVLDDFFTLYRIDSGSAIQLADDSNVNIPENEWILLIVDRSGNTHEVTIQANDGTNLSTITGTDGTYSSGGIGIHAFGTDTAYYDYIVNETEATPTPTQTESPTPSNNTKIPETPENIAFNEMTNPDRLTVSFIILLMGYTVVIPLIGLKLRNPAIFTFWGFSIIILLFTFTTPLDFIWFWGIAILTVIIVGFVSIVRELI